MYIFLVTSLFFLVFGAVPAYSNSPQICFQDAGCSRWSLERGVWNFCCQVLLCGAAEILFITWFLYQNTQDRVFLTKTSQSDRWLSLCIADCYPRASSDCSSFLESSATRRCLGKQSDTFQRKVEYDRGESAPKVLPGRTWGCRKQKNSFFFFSEFPQHPGMGSAGFGWEKRSQGRERFPLWNVLQTVATLMLII